MVGGEQSPSLRAGLTLIALRCGRGLGEGFSGCDM